MTEKPTVNLCAMDHVTDEIVEMTLSIVDGWYETGRVDWVDVWDRLDGRELADGTVLDIPSLVSNNQTSLRKRVLLLRGA